MLCSGSSLWTNSVDSLHRKHAAWQDASHIPWWGVPSACHWSVVVCDSLDCAPRPWIFGVGLDWKAADRLHSISSDHGVDQSQVKARATLLIQAIGLAATQHAVTSGQPWRALKAAATPKGPKHPKKRCFWRSRTQGTVNYRDFSRHGVPPGVSTGWVGGRAGSAYNLRLRPKASGKHTSCVASARVLQETLNQSILPLINFGTQWLPRQQIHWENGPVVHVMKSTWASRRNSCSIKRNHLVRRGMVRQSCCLSTSTTHLPSLFAMEMGPTLHQKLSYRIKDIQRNGAAGSRMREIHWPTSDASSGPKKRLNEGKWSAIGVSDDHFQLRCLPGRPGCTGNCRHDVPSCWVGPQRTDRKHMLSDNCSNQAIIITLLDMRLPQLPSCGISGLVGPLGGSVGCCISISQPLFQLIVKNPLVLMGRDFQKSNPFSTQLFSNPSHLWSTTCFWKHALALSLQILTQAPKRAAIVRAATIAWNSAREADWRMPLSGCATKGQKIPLP